jgi:hypothetical protein
VRSQISVGVIIDPAALKHFECECDLQGFEAALLLAKGTTGALGVWQQVVLLQQWAPFFIKASLLAKLGPTTGVTKHVINIARQHYKEYGGQPMNHPTLRPKQMRMRMDKDVYTQSVTCALTLHSAFTLYLIRWATISNKPVNVPHFYHRHYHVHVQAIGRCQHQLGAAQHHSAWCTGCTLGGVTYSFHRTFRAIIQEHVPRTITSKPIFILQGLQHDKIVQQKCKECMRMCMPCGKFKVATMRHLHVIENISKLMPASEASGFNMSTTQLVSAAKEAINFLLYGFAAHKASDLTEDGACASTCCEFALSDPTGSRRNKGTPYKQACGHEKHGSLCNRCSLILQVLRACNEVLAASCVEGSSETDMHVTALQSCVHDVVCYVGHRIHRVKREKGKAEYVSNMDGQTAFFLPDFMMKMLASNFWCACILTSYKLSWPLQDHWLLLVTRWWRQP